MAEHAFGNASGRLPLAGRWPAAGLAALMAWGVLSVVPGSARGQGYPPERVVPQMKLAPGLTATLFASEPGVRQPILVKCDDRGRLWTIQYLQYPNPAGLSRVKVDRWSRTLYDRVPEPPPRGPKGADRITILEDSDGDGHADRSIDFLSDLNLCTGLEFGHGGVYVLQVPYLLFYADRDRDDRPDGDPEVLLEGFGMEDAQSLANHLTWGPDGWLYGVNGSTTTCRIRGFEFQQGVWRYHPLSKRFELWCEGGSNTYGLTFDERGRLFYSTNAGPLVHGVDGGYFYKSFGKHGPLHNPYAYHYFPPLDCDQVPGGPPTGGTIYHDAGLPDWLRGKFVAGNFLGHTVSWWTIEPAGSTVRARYGGALLDAQDTWFGPTDLCTGPQGEIYVSDFHDRRTAHPDPDANWDRSNGRIVRIAGTAGWQPRADFDLAQLASAELVELLESRSLWWRYRIRAELAARRDAGVVSPLRQRALNHPDTSTALEALWVWHVSAGLDDSNLLALLEHDDPWRRAWAVRLAVDGPAPSLAIQARLIEMGQNRETDPNVLCELACAARRLPANSAVSLAVQLARRPILGDSRLSWLAWWALEHHAISAREHVVETLASPSATDFAETVDSIGWRRLRLNLIRRYAAEGAALGYNACATLMDRYEGWQEIEALQALREGLAERARPLAAVEQGGLFADQAVAESAAGEQRAIGYETVRGRLGARIAQFQQSEPASLLGLELALLAELPGSFDLLTQQITLSAAPGELPARHAHLLELAARFWEPSRRSGAGHAALRQAVLQCFRRSDTELGQQAALDALAHCDRPETADALLAGLNQWSEPVRRRAIEILLSRPAAARKLLDGIDRGQFPADWLAIDLVRRISLLGNAELDDIVRRYWGNVGPGTPEEKLAVMRRLQNDLRAGTGDLDRGREQFLKHCAACHRLLGIGQTIGPDLTTANRHDQAALLANLVDPSAVVRREYLSYVAETTSGQVVTGLLAEEDAARWVLVDAKGERRVLARDEVAALQPATASLMPERIWEAMTPEELRDLFAFLQQ